MLVPISGYATLRGSDNFDDNKARAGKWRVNWYSFGAGKAKLIERNGQIELRSVKSPEPPFDSWQWRKGSSSPSRNWTALFDAKIQRKISGAGFAEIGIEVSEAESDDNDFAGAALLLDEKGIQVESYLYLGGERKNFRRSAPLESQVVTIRMDYDGHEKILTISYDENGPAGGYKFKVLAKYRVGAARGGTASADWEMRPSSRMTIQLAGFCKGVRIAPRQVALDNFRLITWPDLPQMAPQPSDPWRSPFDSLSERELQVTVLIVQGLRLAEIAEKLFLSLKTVNSYRYRIFETVHVKNDVELALLYIRYHGQAPEPDDP